MAYMSNYYIYELIDPITNKTMYIGKTKDIDRRYKNHLYCNRGKESKVNYKKLWIKSLIDNNLEPIINVLDIVSYEDQNYWEKFYIALYKSWGIELLNMTSGGSGFSNLTITDNHKNNISKSLTGKKQPKKVIEKRLGHLKGVNHPRFGITIESDTLIKIIESRVRKSIFQLDSNDNIIKEWKSICLASTELKIPKSNIINTCKGVRANAGGFNWKYKETKSC